jgi:hypothetical protein
MTNVSFLLADSVLGYGFDDNNNSRVGLNDVFKAMSKKFLFTNFGDLNVINKRASLALFGVPHVFLEQSIWSGRGNYAEKSTRNVYEAFEKDFDAVEIR